MNRPSTPPPAGNLVVLAGDLLAVAATKLLEQLAHANWEPATQLKGALDTYEAVRLGQVLRDPDPQCCTLDEPAPDTQRSEVFHG